MGQHYSDPARETDTYALPDVEVFYAEAGEWAYDDNGERCDPQEDGEGNEAGYYWWPCSPGCLPDGEPQGPFATVAEAIAGAQIDADLEDA